MRAMRIWALVLMAAMMLLAGCRREKAAQAEGAPAENSRTAAVDSTRMEMELIEWVGAGVELDR
jgi:PBP1b-binding outer membrane lipoprotein LpoB